MSHSRENGSQPVALLTLSPRTAGLVPKAVAIVPILIQLNSGHRGSGSLLINKRKAPSMRATSWVDLKGIMLNEKIMNFMI